MAAAGLVLVGCLGGPPAPPLSEEQRAIVEALVVEAPPFDMLATDARFDEVSLVGYRLEPRALSHRRGQAVKLTLVWQIEGALDAGWQPFTHLYGEGRMLLNLDASGPLRALSGVAGAPLPAHRWPEDHYVLDELRFTMPARAPEHVTILAGFFRGRERHPVEGKAIDARHRAAWVKLRATGDDPAEPEVPSLRVPQRSGPIVLDGALDEADWQSAAKTGAFVHPTTGAPNPSGPVHGRARLLWDEEHLYAAFTVVDRDLRGGFPSDALDPQLWTRDTIELMIDPEGDNRDYFEVQVGPQNLVFDSRFDDYNRPRGGDDGPFGHQDWSSAVESAVRLEGSLDDDAADSGYVVELRLPWAALKQSPAVGDSWRINLYAMQDNGGVAWSPILGRGNFHFAPRFGRVTFTE